MNAEEILFKMDQFEAERSNFDMFWQECYDYASPQNSQVTVKKEKGYTPKDLFDTTGEDSVVQLAAGLYSYMFPADSKAFVLRIEDPALAEDDAVKLWMDAVTTKIHEYLIQSNFRQSFFEFLKSLAVSGTANLFVEKGKKQALNFICFHMAGVYIDVDEEGNIDTVFRKFEYTARQAVMQFGDQAGSLAVESAKDPKRAMNKFQYIHAVYPRKDYKEGSSDPLLMPVACKYISRKEKSEVYESGYPEMPYMITRFDLDAQEKYGRSPTMKKLPDIKMINQMKKTRIKAWDKMCDPPVVLPDDGSIWPLATQPGGVLYKRAGGEDPTWFEFKGNLQGMEEAIADVRADIRSGYFLDLFDALIDRQNMTATEVMARVEQKIRMLTPIIGRLQSEFFNPLINRIIGVLSRSGKLPPAPAALSGANYKIEYLGRLALALKTLESEGFVKTMEELRILLESQLTDFLDNYDIDQISRDVGLNNGMPAAWIKSVKKRDADRKAKQEAMMKQKLMEEAKNLSGAAVNLGKAPEEGSITREAMNAA